MPPEVLATLDAEAERGHKQLRCRAGEIRKGVEVVVEQNHCPVAVIRSPKRSGRPISECIASAKPSGSRITLDGGFEAELKCQTVEDLLTAIRQRFGEIEIAISAVTVAELVQSKEIRDGGIREFPRSEHRFFGSNAIKPRLQPIFIL